MKNYLFISNSTKPSIEKAQSREIVKLGTVSKPCIEAALAKGYKVYYGVNRNKPEELKCDYPVLLYDSHTYRSLTAIRDNITAYKNTCDVIEKGKIRVIHCNTPVGGLIGRICGKKYRIKKVIYTAHGFHFYKGAPFINRTLYKWAEQFLARWTDAIITMNQEDYEAAKKFKIRNKGKVYLVHGVGIDLSKFVNSVETRNTKREELNLKPDDIALISAGDLIPRKNYRTAIQAIAKSNNSHLHYFICGKGPDREYLEELKKELNVEQQIHFLGFRTDIKELMSASDIFLFTTTQEGLPRSMMEAMACGLPCISSNIRGNVDLITDGNGGFLCNPYDADSFAEAINTLASDVELRKRFSDYNLKKIKDYDVSVVEKEIREIYDEIL